MFELKADRLKKLPNNVFQSTPLSRAKTC